MTSFDRTEALPATELIDRLKNVNTRLISVRDSLRVRSQHQKNALEQAAILKDQLRLQHAAYNQSINQLAHLFKPIAVEPVQLPGTPEAPLRYRPMDSNSGVSGDHLKSYISPEAHLDRGLPKHDIAVVPVASGPEIKVDSKTQLVVASGEPSARSRPSRFSELTNSQHLTFISRSRLETPVNDTNIREHRREKKRIHQQEPHLATAESENPGDAAHERILSPTLQNLIEQYARAACRIAISCPSFARTEPRQTHSNRTMGASELGESSQARPLMGRLVPLGSTPVIRLRPGQEVDLILTLRAELEGASTGGSSWYNKTFADFDQSNAK